MVVRTAIVEDKGIVRTAIKDKLTQFPDICIVLEAANGEDFLEKIRQMDVALMPEIVLTDLEMPVMDGIRTIAVASTLFPEMKFIVLTIYDHHEKIFEAIRAGASGYILKDDDAVRLNEAIVQAKLYNAVPMSPAIARKILGLLQTAPASAPAPDGSALLTIRERDVLQGLVDGLDYKDISENLFISPRTVRTHITNIYKKLHVTSKAQAITLAYKNRWFS